MRVRVNNKNVLEVRDAPGGSFDIDMPKFLEFNEKYWFRVGAKYIMTDGMRVGRVLEKGDPMLDMTLEWGHCGLELWMSTANRHGGAVKTKVDVSYTPQMKRAVDLFRSIQVEDGGLWIYHDLFDSPLDVEVVDVHFDPISLLVSARVTLPAEPVLSSGLIVTSGRKRRHEYVITIPNSGMHVGDEWEYLQAVPGSKAYPWSYRRGRVGDGVRNFLLDAAEQQD